MSSREADILVIGAGPAGCTLAGLVKKKAPSRRVVLIEKSPGPRHMVGESLLPGLVPVLKELGVYEKIDAAGFPRKIGANYLWGKGRRVWENDFNDVNVEEMLKRGGIPERVEYAWQVRRSAYDELLLRHAEELGVEVRRGVAARAPLEDGERIVGVESSEGPIRAGLVADCSGYSGFLSRHRRVRRYDRRLRHVATFAYFRGAPWKYVYSGHPDKTKIFICSTGRGWFWYIPIDGGVVSVGLVTSQAALKASGLPPHEHYLRELRRCRELWPLLKDAERLSGFDGSGKEFHTRSDWSYLNVAAAGPGWLAAGDAALFVDPILSTGVTLAHLCAHRAAYTVLTDWERPDAALWEDYNRYCRESGAQFLALALFWYGNDRKAERWWKKAGELQRASLPVALGDHQAFITVSAGLTQHYERLFTTEALAERAPTRPGDFPFYASVLGADAGLESRARAAAGDGAVPRLSCRFRTEPAWVCDQAAGRLRPVKRVRFVKFPSGRGLGDALNPRRIVLGHHIRLLERLDGRRTLAQALEGLDAPAWWKAGPARVFLRELSVQGVLELR